MRADSDEHFPPQSWGMKGVVLPACRECNSVALNFYPQDFWKRVSYVKSKLEKRYLKDLRLQDWSDDELSELSKPMRESVKSCLERKKIVTQRIAWNVKSYLKNIAQDKYSVHVLADSGITMNAKDKP